MRPAPERNASWRWWALLKKKKTKKPEHGRADKKFSSTVQHSLHKYVFFVRPFPLNQSEADGTRLPGRQSFLAFFACPFRVGAFPTNPTLNYTYQTFTFSFEKKTPRPHWVLKTRP